MANPVTDQLDVWKNDSTGNDTNLPAVGAAMGTGQVAELAGELRLLKSEIKGAVETLSWERWKGERNLADTANVAFTFSTATVFTINDDFVGATRAVAIVGRRVRATLAASTLYGVITIASFSTPTTTVTVLWDSGAMDAGLTEIAFGAEPRAVSIAGVANRIVGWAGTNIIGSSSANLTFDGTNLTVGGSILGLTGGVNGDELNLNASDGVRLWSADDLYFRINVADTAPSRAFIYEGSGGAVLMKLFDDFATRGINLELYGNLIFLDNSLDIGRFDFTGTNLRPRDVFVQRNLNMENTRQIRAWDSSGMETSSDFVPIMQVTGTPFQSVDDHVLIARVQGAGTGLIQWGVPLVALGGGASAVFGTIGGSGPATAAENT